MAKQSSRAPVGAPNKKRRIRSGFRAFLFARFARLDCFVALLLAMTAFGRQLRKICKAASWFGSLITNRAHGTS
jgi:hypothetical protein